MLTSDLLRIEVAGNGVKPLYISRKESGMYLDIAERILSVFRSGIGTPRSKLHAELQRIEHQANFKVVRGLAKLVEDECLYMPAVDTEYPALRAEVFARAQERYPLVTTTDLLHPTHRDDAVAAIAAALGYSRSRLEELLFADLPPYQVLREVHADASPERLLQRYNLALAQALLYRAVSMNITLTGDFSFVWKYVKLAQLIHEIEKRGDAYTFHLTGSASVFRQTQRYGIRMARFLPGLLLAKEFTMDAAIAFNGAVRVFRLDHTCGLRSHYHDAPKEFDSGVEQRFFKAF